jgi:hypothetical protein
MRSRHERHGTNGWNNAQNFCAVLMDINVKPYRAVRIERVDKGRMLSVAFLDAFLKVACHALKHGCP